MSSKSNQTSSSRTAVVWFRRDLRLSDHPALIAAVSGYDRVVPLFVWDPQLTRVSGLNRMAFLAGCVDALDRDLDGQLVIRNGKPEKVVTALVAEVGAKAVFITEDFGPYGRQRDVEVARQLPPACELVRDDSPYVVAPGTLLTRGGSPFQVYSAFAKAWREHAVCRTASPSNLKKITRAGLANSSNLPKVTASSSFPEVGEKVALQILEAFFRQNADEYDSHRDRPDLDSTSRLSSYIRFGLVHPRQILARLDPRKAGHDIFESELIWREFYADVLFHRPDAARASYRQEWRSFQVDKGKEADERFEAWAEGMTGFPIVDAGMRQLLAEGWMHNRVRMITASFLIKDLHIDWRRGARWFMRHLVDGDLASNQLNWQWVSGSGNDAAPYFRVFNPITQGRKFDPNGEYIRRWVPELQHCPRAHIHEPWRYGALGSYPEPLVDHGIERQEALARYGRLRAQR